MNRLFNNPRFKLVFLLMYDVITIIISMICALFLSRVGNNYGEYLKNLQIYGVGLCLVSIITYQAFRLYNSLWKYASISEMLKMVVANILIFVINIGVAFTTKLMPISWTIIMALLNSGFCIIGRFFYRFLLVWKNSNFPLKHDKIENERVMIIGAGDAGQILVREMKQNPELKMVPVCIIDDNPNKKNQNFLGIRICGDRNDIIRSVEKFEISLIVIAMPSVKKSEIAKILEICQKTGIKIKLIPGLYQLVNGKISVKNIRDVEVQDLLGRDQINVNLKDIMNYVQNKVVLVTGGGGSIGAELCRQIAKNNPKMLIIFDIYENNAYSIEQELKRDCPTLNLLTLIGSVRDHIKVDDVFSKYHPDIVYHAAAHKHVPLMETSPNEAVKNNVFGTLKVAKAADKYHTKRFILISTDKAVNPTNIMGATKRICEMIVQTINKKSETEFVAVRFGNVLGSNGSVIPLFKEQIKNGGPVTVTHKDITRFFMTIPEAVALVLQAGAFAKGGEIFVLDMGKPVRIYDLAENLVRLSGYTPNVDMKIEITGLRPGEKLYEELLMSEEGLQETPNHLIHIGKPIVLDEEKLFIKLDELYKLAYEETDRMKEVVSDLVPTYHYQK